MAPPDLGATTDNMVAPLGCRHTAVSHQLIEQCLGVLEDWGVESFREPAVDRREEVAGLGEFALVVLETCKLEGCT